MTKIRKFVEGKKAYICAGALALAAILGWWCGYIQGPQATTMLATAGALAGLGAKSQRTANTVLAALTEVHHVVNQTRLTQQSGHPVDTKQLAVDLAQHITPQLVSAAASVIVGASTFIPVAGTPAVGAPAPTPGCCVYCGTSWYGLKDFECKSPDNKSTPDSVGKRYHVFASAATGSAVK